MPKVRQLSEIYLRGALANVTMRQLTPAQRQHVEQLVQTLTNHPILAGHKHEFLYALRTTIACDYKNPDDALTEYRIAIWRAIVHIFYHTDYTFQCTACGSTDYLSQRGTRVPINRQFDFCPVCNHCAILDPGDSTCQPGVPVTGDEFAAIQDNIARQNDERRAYSHYTIACNPYLIPPSDFELHFADICFRLLIAGGNVYCDADCIAVDDLKAHADHVKAVERLLSDIHVDCCRSRAAELPPLALPTYHSCITAIPGKSKVENPELILQDDIQITKMFGSFIWNYLRQILLENRRIYHDRKTRNIVGPADCVAVKAIVCLLNDIDAYCIYNPNENPTNHSPQYGSHYTIMCDPYLIPPDDFELRFADIRCRLLAVGGDVCCGPNQILVKDLKGQAACLELVAPYCDEVQVVNNSSREEDGEPLEIITQVEARMSVTDSPAMVDMGDELATIRESLPEGDCQRIFELLQCQGPIYQQFAERYPDAVKTNGGIPHQNRMAEFLGCTTKDIKRHQDQIRLQLIGHGITGPY
jgi:hypothetical protein